MYMCVYMQKTQDACKYVAVIGQHVMIIIYIHIYIYVIHQHLCMYGV